MIKDGSDLRIAWDNLLFLKSCDSLIKNCANRKIYTDYMIRTKREIRAYNKRLRDRQIVRDDGIDGYVEKVTVPPELLTKKDRERWFEEEELMVCKPSIYDCTGQRFTGWYRFVRLHGEWYLYHGVEVDV